MEAFFTLPDGSVYLVMAAVALIPLFVLRTIKTTVRRAIAIVAVLALLAYFGGQLGISFPFFS